MIRYEDGAVARFRTIPSIATGAWVHLGINYDRTAGLRVFVDGEPVALRVLNGDLAHRTRVLSFPDQTIYLGGFDRTFPGRLDDVRLFSRALSAGEFHALSRGDDVSGGLLAHWPLVFWSGCVTATGASLPDESLSGLSAAGWLAGARATVATLWPVYDETTPVQVEAFYRAWLRGESPARAVQAALRAGLDLTRRREGGSHPVFSRSRARAAPGARTKG